MINRFIITCTGGMARSGPWLALLPVLALSFVLACNRGGSEPSAAINLGGAWKVLERRDNAPAARDFSDSGSPELALPGNWSGLLEKNHELAGTFWLRKSFGPVRGLDDQTMVLYLGNFGVADRAYINGVFIGGEGRFPAGSDMLDYKSAWHRERLYQFPSSLISDVKTNVVAVKVFSHVINGTRDMPQIMSLQEWNDRHWIHEFIPAPGGMNPMLMSFLLLIFLVIMVEGTLNRKILVYSVFFIFGVFMVMLLLFGMPEFDNNRHRFKLFFVAYAFTDFVLLLLLQEFFTIKSRALTMAAGAALFAVTAFIAYAPTTEYLIHRAGGATVLVVSLYIAAALTLFLMALYRDPRRYWHLVIWTVIILISAANTLYGLALYRFYAISFSFALRLPLLLFAAVLVYLIELKNIKKERDSLTQALLKKSREVQRLSRPPARGETRLISRDIIQDLVEYLDSNYHETYDRAALARRFNLSEDYMGHLFKKATSTNIANYINCRRIEAAKQLLEETDSKVIDIAFHVGFDNLTYFYRHFKKVTGYSPADYRARKRDSLYRFDSVSEEVL